VQPVETKYAWLGRDRIAYQVLGQGPPDLVVSFGSFGHIDIAWEDPGIALFFRTLASFSRLILFDRRGTGASDPVLLDALPPWEGYAEELDAVLDQVASERVAIMAHVDAGAMAMLFAATRPERTSALVLVNCSAKWAAADDYPIGIPLEVAQAIVAQIDQLWGTEALVGMWAASRAGDERFRRWSTKYQRAMASPRTIQAFNRVNLEVDARPILPLIHAPTLVLARRDFPVLSIEHSRYLAEHIPQAKLVELPGADALLAGRRRNSPSTCSSSSSRVSPGSPSPPGYSRPCCSPISSARPSGPDSWATGAGARSWACTTSWAAAWSRSSTASWSRPPVMGSWPPLTAPAERSVARRPCVMSFEGSACRSERACIPARSSSATMTSAASACTSPPGSSPRPNPVRSSPQGPCATWWWAPTSRPRIGELTT
jgi:pimeloyl-ACP methyl ester carboxylesterase